MMTMTQKLQMHREIEREDREHRTWHHNNLILDQLTSTFPIGTMVENFGVAAEVVGYQVAAATLTYTGDLILEEPESAMRWIGNPDFCMAIA